MKGNARSAPEVGAFEAKNTLGTLLDRVERGEEIIITRHGKPVARLVPNTGPPDQNEVQAAFKRMRERARDLAKKTPGTPSIPLGRTQEAPRRGAPMILAVATRKPRP
jgi:prevent-host-death family protein